jgi:hypothetical protein
MQYSYSSGLFSFVLDRLELALAASFMLGLGDACIQTQLCSIMSALYAEDSAPPFAIFQFFQVGKLVTTLKTKKSKYERLRLCC